MDKRLWQVDVHRDNNWGRYRVLAIDDVTARARAIKLDRRFSDNADGDITYCEIKLFSEIDSRL